MKIHTFILCFILLAVCTAVSPVYAAETESDGAGKLTKQAVTAEADERVIRLKSFLHRNNSPMEESAETFVQAADKNNLNWTFVAAIAGLESGFGKHIPEGSYNAWGWGIPTGASSGIGFTDWNHGIQTVSEGLRNNYVNKGAVGVYNIGRRYAASPTWAVRVEYFMDKILTHEPTDSSALDISL